MTEGPTRRRSPAGRTRDRTRPPAPEPLPVPVVDTHCHLDIADGDIADGDIADGDIADGDIAEGLESESSNGWTSVPDALAAAAAVGVPRIVQIGCDLPGARWAVRCASTHDAVVAGVALHPNEAPLLAAGGGLCDALSEIDRLAGSARVRAVGETGLDYFRTGPEGRAAQEESFRAHIEMAKRHGKALVIHDRDAHADVLAILDDAGAPDVTVFHCYSGDAAMARHCAERGWFLSFAGTVTFKNAEPLREALAATPLANVLVETDAPYLTPHPHRGRPNASYLVPLTVRTMAAVAGVALEDMCRALDANTARAFGHW